MSVDNKNGMYQNRSSLIESKISEAINVLKKGEEGHMLHSGKNKEETSDNWDSKENRSKSQQEDSKESEINRDRPPIPPNKGVRSYSVQKKSSRYITSDPVNIKNSYSKPHAKITDKHEKSSDNRSAIVPKESSSISSKKTERGVYFSTKPHNNPSYRKYKFCNNE